MFQKISFQFRLTTGEHYQMYERQNKTFLSVLQKFVVEKCPKNLKIKKAITSGLPVKMNETLLENNINEGSIVLIVVEVFNLSNINNINKININKSLQPKLSSSFSQNNIFKLNQNNSLIRNRNHGKINLNIYNINISPPRNPRNNIYNKLNTIPNDISFQNSVNSNLTQLSEILEQNQLLLKCKNFLINECKIPKEIFDEEGDCIDNDWRVNKKSGPPGYLKDYFPPLGWIGIGLKVSGLYDNGDDNWLSSDNKIGEWYIAYHPIKTIDSIMGILKNGFRRGPFQDYKNIKNINPLTNVLYPKCNEGVYFIPDINEAKIYTEIFEYLGNKFRIAFMCRINPYAVRIANIETDKESWVVNGDLLNDPVGIKRDKEVRPYRIIMFIEN